MISQRLAREFSPIAWFLLNFCQRLLLPMEEKTNLYLSSRTLQANK
jgi:hypothetical protein